MATNNTTKVTINASPNDPFPCAVNGRLVPNGAQRGKLKLSMLLSPELCTFVKPYDVPANERLDLRTWPADIMGRLKKASLAVKVIPIPMIAPSDPKPDPDSLAMAEPIPARAPGLKRIRRRHFIALNQAWQASLQPKQEATTRQNQTRSAADRANTPEVVSGGWNDLALGLQQTLNGTGTTAGRIAEGKDIAAATSDRFGDDGQLKRVEPNPEMQIDGIMDVPHADLALALEFQRAEELRLSLQEGCGISGVREAAENEQIARTAAKTPTPPSRPDTKMNTEGMKPEEAKAAKEKRVEDEKEKLKAELRDRKLQQHAALVGDLKKNREEARTAFATEKADHAAKSCADVTGAPTWKPNLRAHQAADTATREESLDALTGAHSYATWPQYTDQKTITDMEKEGATQAPTDFRQKKIVQTYFSIQSNPVLSRAFGLTVDVEIDADALVARMGNAIYCYVSVDLSALTPPGCDVPARAPVWTLAKVQQRGGKWHFWPATEEEMLDHVSCANQPRRCYLQYDGVMMMGEGSSDNPAEHAPRFDLTGIDIRTATEMERQRRDTRSANIASAKAHRQSLDKEEAPAKGANRNAQWNDLAFGAKLQTSGLTLMCRSQKVDTARVLARRHLRGTGTGSGRSTVLDANDLTSGFRLAVGTPMSGGDFRTEWRSLMHRVVTYETSGKNLRPFLEDVDRQDSRGRNDPTPGVLSRLIGPAGSPERLALEAAFLSVPNRLLPSGEPGAQVAEAVVEQAIAVWNGDPMGVDCTPSGLPGPTVRDAMSFGRQLGLPNRGDGVPLPRPLRYGTPYRFAMTAVFSGGHSVPLDSLPDDATPKVGDCLYYPPDALNKGGTKPYFRALRHDKLAPPQVLLPVGHATRSFSARGQRPRVISNNAGPMGFEHGRKMVIRSLVGLSEKDKKNNRLLTRELPKISQRIVLVPNLPLDDVIRHGVYDNYNQNRQPPGDLRDVALTSGNKESFPVTQTTSKRGINNRYFVQRRGTQDNPDAKIAGPELSLGDPVFGPGSNSDSRVYPDPAADVLVMGLRRKGEATYLSGGPVQTLLQPENGYPNQLPVVITVNSAGAESRPRPQNITDIVGNEGVAQRIRFDPTDTDNIITKSRSARAASAFTLSLAPGEAYEIDLWCAPSAERLAREFAIIQSLGMALAQSVTPDIVCSAEKILEAAGVKLPPVLFKRLEKALEGCDAKELLGYVGPGGIAAPSNRVLKSLAAVVHKVLLCHPLPEIAAKVTIDAVHACNRTPAAPEINALKEPHDPLLANSVNPETLVGEAQGLVPLSAQRPDPPDRAPVEDPAGNSIPAANQPPNTGVLPTVNEGSSFVQLGGEVEIDLNANDSVEIIAKTVLPGTAVFDDRNRGRSMAFRRAGVWPKKKTAKGLVETDKNGKPIHRPALDVYGFKLSPDGRATLEEFEVTLLRIEGLEAVEGAGLTRMDLRPYFEEVGHGPARITYRHVFPDGKARVMQVRASALSRTAEMMATVNRIAQSDDPWTSGEGLIYETGEMVPGEVMPPEHQANDSNTVTVILPATIRPAKCDARTPVPVFDWDKGDTPRRGRPATWVRRRSVIRIPLGREWFSSGQDERLGLVLWPPEMPTETLEQSNYVDLPGVTNDAPNRTVKLPTFEDDDLGPGGAFITRMGADPLRGGRDQKRTFLSLDDFPDLDRDPDHVSYAQYVPGVEMPLSDPEETGEAPATPPLRVGLLTYAPRFDPDAEEWYVDVSIAPGVSPESFVRFGLVRYQPHTVPELRCSRPVTQWSQPMPGRYAVAQRATGGGDAGLTLSVSGPAFERRAVSSSLHENKRELVQSPLMQVTVFEEQEAPEGGCTRFVLAQSDAASGGLVDAKRIIPTLSDGIANWSLDLRKGDLEAREGSRIKVLIEEIEMYEPATYAQEPLDPLQMTDWNQTLLPSGPRFAATLDVTNLLTKEPSTEEK